MNVNIASDKIKDYTSLSRDCTFQRDGIKIGPRRGKITIDLIEFRATKCDLHFKRISGNGKVLIKSGESLDVIVGSKKSQTFSIDVDDLIEITRVNGAGEVVLLGITVYSSEESMPDWRDIIKKCGKYKCVRMVDSRLFASSGGFIEDNNAIKKITTSPSGMFAREGNRIKFLGSCEITNIDIDGPTPMSVSSPYVDRNAPTPNIAPPGNKPINSIKIPNIPNQSPFPPRRKDAQEYMNSNIVFNSTALKAFDKYHKIKNKLLKPIRSNNKTYLLLRKGGKCSISISQLQNNTEYIIVIKAKKLNGNGKMFLTLATQENEFTDMVEELFNVNFKNIYVMLKTKISPYGKFHKLNMAMGDNSSGEILIEEITIVENIGLHRTRGLIEHGFYNLNHQGPSLTSGSTISTDSDLVDDACKISKKYARYIPINADSEVLTKAGSIATTTTSGMNWLCKVDKLLPDMHIIKNIETTHHDTLIISKMGALIPCKKVWIDAFIESEMTDNNISILNTADHIFSPSIINVQLLKSKLPNIKIDYSMRPIPYITPKEISFFKSKEFVLCFHRSSESTLRILESWKPHFPILVLVGGRGLFPDNIIPINEYMPYDQILYLISKCKFIVDIPTCINYDSALLNLAYHMGVPIISSNWSALTKDNCIFLPPTKGIGSFKMPTVSTIQCGIGDAYIMPRGPNRIQEYKAKFIVNMNKLFV